MRTLFIVVLLIGLAACRFEQPIPAALDLDSKDLIGDWKESDGEGRVIISDLRYGRLRMLYRDGNQGMVLDGHIIRLDGQQFLQTHIIAMIGANNEQQPLPRARWMSWKLSVKDKVMTVRAVKSIPFSGETDTAVIESSTQALANPKNFNSARKWNWIGSDKPAKL